MKLGAFSISLGVKNLERSKEFYEKLGFRILAGSSEKKYYILQNEHRLIGIFEGMFDGHMLTFNPGWDQNGKPQADFQDIREIQQKLDEAGIDLAERVNEETSGPAHLVCKDPDGNIILIDQHV